MKIRITAGGIYDGNGGEVPVGTELTVKEEPTGWTGRYVVLSGGDDSEKTAITNPAKDAPAPLEAKHRGGGSYSIMRGDEEVVEKLSKADAEAFNAMSDDDKAAYVSKA